MDDVIKDFKAQIFDILASQAAYQAEIQKLESGKNELLKKLQEAQERKQDEGYVDEQ